MAETNEALVNTLTLAAATILGSLIQAKLRLSTTSATRSKGLRRPRCSSEKRSSKPFSLRRFSVASINLRSMAAISFCGSGHSPRRSQRLDFAKHGIGDRLAAGRRLSPMNFEPSGIVQRTRAEAVCARPSERARAMVPRIGFSFSGTSTTPRYDSRV
jgi:hypothetical protein